MNRPGNCNMSMFNNYRTPMLADDSPCGPYCPPGGEFVILGITFVFCSNLVQIVFTIVSYFG